jgi:hypothetical protein
MGSKNDTLFRKDSKKKKTILSWKIIKEMTGLPVGDSLD